MGDAREAQRSSSYSCPYSSPLPFPSFARRRLHWLPAVLIKKRTLLGDRDDVPTAPVPDQHLYHIGDETVLAYGHRTARLSGPVNPNDWSDDPQYIIDLVKRIVTVSLETMKIVNGLPGLGV